MSGPTGERYELRTLRDIVEKIPADRLPAFLEQFEVAVASTKFLVGMAEAMGQPNPLDSTDPPAFDPLVWDDDGENETTFRVHDRSGEEVVELAFGREPSP